MAQPNNTDKQFIKKNSVSGDQSFKVEPNSSLSDVLKNTAENRIQPNTMVTDPKEVILNQSADVHVEEKPTTSSSTPNCKPNDSSTSLAEGKESKSIPKAVTDDQDKKLVENTCTKASIQTSIKVNLTAKDTSFPPSTNQTDSHPKVFDKNDNVCLLNQTKDVMEMSKTDVAVDQKIPSDKEDVTVAHKEQVITTEVNLIEPMNAKGQEMTADIHLDTRKPPALPLIKTATDCQSTQIDVHQPHTTNDIKIVESVEHRDNVKRKMSSSPQEFRPLMKKQKQDEAVPDIVSNVDKAVSTVMSDIASNVDKAVPVVMPDDASNVDKAVPVVIPDNTNNVDKTVSIVAPGNTSNVDKTISIVAPGNTNNVDKTVSIAAPDNTSSMDKAVPVVMPDNTSNMDKTVPVVMPDNTSNVDKTVSIAAPGSTSNMDKTVSIEKGVQKLAIQNGIKSKEPISHMGKQQKSVEVDIPQEDKEMTDVHKLSFKGHIEVSAYGGHRVVAYVDGKELTGWVVDEQVLVPASDSAESKQNGVIAKTPSPQKKSGPNGTRRRPRMSPVSAVARRLLPVSKSFVFSQSDTDSGLTRPISSRDVPLRSVIVIGSGISGVTAAKALSDRGFYVTVLEARSRLGGRIATDWSMGCPVDLGAAFIHGSHGNPLTEITREAGLRTYSFRDKGVMMRSNGEKVDPEVDEHAYNLWQALLKRAQGIAKGDKLKHASSDVSLGRLLDRLKDEIVSDYDESVENLLSWHVSNLETACAAELPDLSAKHYDMDDERGFAGSHKLIRDGFSSVVAALAKDLDIRYNSAVVGIQRDVPVQFQLEERSRARKEARNQTSRTSSGGAIDLTLTPRKEVKYLDTSSPVTKVHDKTKSGHTKKSSAVRVVLQSGQEYFAESCIVTVPLGVLQRKMISFSPPLPRWKEEAAENIGFGLLNKVILRFSTPFWVNATRKEGDEEDFGTDGPDYIGRVSNQQGVFFIFMSLLRPLGAPILVALSTGRFAEYIEEKSDDEVVGMAMKSLEKLFPSSPPSTLLSHKVTRWKMDKYARGSYSYAQVGTTPKDYTVMSEPVGDIYFAGEATHESHPATVHGAFMSGVREAARIISSSNLNEELRAEYAEELRLMQDPRAATEISNGKHVKQARRASHSNGSKSKTDEKPVANGSTSQRNNNRNSRRRSQR